MSLSADGISLPREVLSAWIENVDWKWMATLTFEDAVGAERAEQTFRRFENGLNAMQYGPRWKSSDQGGAHWFRIAEHQKRGVLHFHVLFSNLSTPTRRFDRASRAKAKALWTEKAGHCKFEPIRSRAAVCNYLAKHYGRGAEFDFSRSLTEEDFRVRELR